MGFTTLGTFASTSNLVFIAQYFRFCGGVVHPLIGRYVLQGVTMQDDPMYETSNKLKDWHAFLNDIVGVFALSIAVSALCSSYPKEIATLGVIFITVWAFTKNFSWGVKKHQEREERYIGRIKSNLFSFIRSPCLVIGYFLLFYIAMGELTIESLEGFSFQNFFTL
ncbi:hypothetical protein [Vibrio cidicii]|nr:hypothetical protein [Vibrio cidicii]